MSNTLTDIKVGKIVKIGDEPYLVVASAFLRKQQRKPVMKTKLKSVITGSTLEKSFLSGETFEFADIAQRKCQYLYNDGMVANFMDGDTYEQFEIPLDSVEEQLKFMLDGTDVYVTFFEDRPVAVQLPPKIELRVTETPPGVKGDTAQGGMKPATLESGAVIRVPLFIEVDELIRVNTETGEYVERVK